MGSRGFGHRLAWLVLGLAVTGAVGCGRDIYPVTGKIVLKDGSSPSDLKGYQIVFEGDGIPVSAAGELQADGSFTVGTLRPGDGAKPGKYKVLFHPPVPDSDAPPPKSLLLDRYRDVKTTDQIAEVKAEANSFTFTLERAKRKK